MLVMVPVRGTFCVAVGYLKFCCGTDMSMGQGMAHLPYKHRLRGGAVQPGGKRAVGRAESSL